MLIRFILPLIVSFASNALAVDASAFEQDTKEVRRICMGTLCLGMTIQEVRKVTPPLNWISPPNGKVVCHKQETIGAKFVDVRGDAFNLGFALVKTSGLPVDRYRLSIISVRMPDLSLQDVQNELFKVGKQNHIPLSFGTGFGSRNTDSGHFLLLTSTMSLSPEEGGGYNLTLASIYNREEDWLKSLSECRNATSGP